MPEKVSLKVNVNQPGSAEEPVPTDLVPLPSNGVVYPTDSALFNQQTVAIRSMTARDEDILTSQALLRSGKALSMLLRGCMVGTNFDPDKMLSADRNAVLIGIRITGYGPEYKVSMICAGCGEKIEHEVNLAGLPIKRFPEGVTPIEPGINRFAFMLPISGRKVHFKLLTGEDEREILKTVERSRKNNLNESLITTRLKVQILSIDGEEDPGKLARMIDTMSARDSRELRAYMDHITPGVELKTDFVCSACGHEDQGIEVPIGTEFFWPSA